MNILYTGQFRFPNKDAASARVLNIGKILKSLGHSVFFLAWGGEMRSSEFNKGEYIYQGFAYEVSKDLDKSSIKSKIVRNIVPGKNAYKMIEQKIDSYDVIIAYNTPLIFNIRLKSICHTHNVKTILDLSEWYSVGEYWGGCFSPFYWINEYNMRIYNHKISNKIVISSYLKGCYKGEHAIQIPPLVDLSEEKWENTSSLKVDIQKDEGTTFIYAGYISHKDNIELFIDAMAELLAEGEKLRLIVLGTMKNQLSRRTQKMLSKIGNNVAFLGRVPQNLVPAYYKLADFSIILRERTRKNMAGFPTKLVESVAAGIPVLMNDNSDILQYMNVYKAYVLIEDLNINSVKASIKKCIQIVDKQKMSQDALLCAKRYFHYQSWKLLVNNFLDNLQ